MGEDEWERSASPWCRVTFSVGLSVGLSASSVDRRAAGRVGQEEREGLR